MSQNQLPKRRLGRRSFGVEPLEDRCLFSADLSLAAPIMEMRLVVTDMIGKPVEKMVVGSDFRLQLRVKDLRTGPGAKGAFAAYGDISYRAAMVGLRDELTTATLRLGASYVSAPFVDASKPGLLNEVGALAVVLSPSGLGSGDFLVAEFDFQAREEGFARFGLDPADDEVMRAMLAYGEDASVTARTVFLGTTLEIVGTDTGSVTDDGWIPAEDTSGVSITPTILRERQHNPLGEKLESHPVPTEPHLPWEVNLPFEFQPLPELAGSDAEWRGLRSHSGSDSLSSQYSHRTLAHHGDERHLHSAETDVEPFSVALQDDVSAFESQAVLWNGDAMRSTARWSMRADPANDRRSLAAGQEPEAGVAVRSSATVQDIGATRFPRQLSLGSTQWMVDAGSRSEFASSVETSLDGNSAIRHLGTQTFLVSQQ